jgi:hypothetical protein
MSEYIERGALIDKRHKVCEYDEAGFCVTYQAVPVEDIQQAPAADVVEVKHAEWEVVTDDYDCEMMRCSCCGSEFYDGENDTVDMMLSYCPNCGAKMDGECREG